MYSKQDLIAKGRNLGMGEKEIELISKIDDCETIDYYVYAWSMGFRGEDLDLILKWVLAADNFFKKIEKEELPEVPFDSEDDVHFYRINNKCDSKNLHEELKKYIIKNAAVFNECHEPTPCFVVNGVRIIPKKTI